MPEDAAFWQFLYLIFSKRYDGRHYRDHRRFCALPTEPFTPEGQKEVRDRIQPLFEAVGCLAHCAALKAEHGRSDRPGHIALHEHEGSEQRPDHGDEDNALDRMARSVRDAAYVFDELDRAGVLVLSVTDVVDMGSLGHRMWPLIHTATAAP